MVVVARGGTAHLAHGQALMDRILRCRYTSRYGDRCTGQAVDDLGEIILCAFHLGLALEMLRRVGALR